MIKARHGEAERPHPEGPVWCHVRNALTDVERCYSCAAPCDSAEVFTDRDADREHRRAASLAYALALSGGVVVL